MYFLNELEDGVCAVSVMSRRLTVVAYVLRKDRKAQESTTIQGVRSGYLRKLLFLTLA